MQSHLLKSRPWPWRSVRRLTLRLFVLLALLPALLLPRSAALAAQALAAAAPAGPQAGRVRMAIISDTHWIAGGANTQSKAVLAQVAALGPDLVIHTGDVTETGGRREYEEYRQAVAVFGDTPVLHVPGNHDARWLDPGKAWFRQYLGEVPRTLDWHGVHLVLLDSTVATETHGHLDRSTLQWLAGHLQQVGPDRPVLIFLHHPVFYTPVTYTDTDDEFVAALAPYNVRGVFTGHGHLHMRWERNGIPFFMTQAAMEGGYKIVDLDPAARTLTVYDGNVDGTLTQVVTLPLDPPTPRPAPPTITRVALEGSHLRVEAQAHGLPPGLQYWARVGTAPWQPMGPSYDPGTLVAQLPVAGLPPGRHRVQVWIAPPGAALPGELLSGDQWLQRNAGPSWSAYQDVDLPPGAAGAPRELWRLGFVGGIQGSPALGPDGTAYAATLAGEVVAVAPDGQVRWRRETPAPVVGAPTFVPGGSGTGNGGLPGSGLLLVPGTDGTLRALDPATGEVRWQAHLGAPLMAQPLAAAGLVFIGDSKGVLHALDLSTGAPRWQYQAGAAIRSRATYGAGTVFVGAWDTAVHAVDAFTGKPRWVRTLPGSVYYAPANQPPLFFRGRVYVTRSQPSGHASLYALDARTGEILWSAQGSYGYSAPVLHGGLLVVASSGGTVVAFDPVTGQQRWSVATGVTTFDGAISSFAGDLALAGLGGEVALVRPGGGSAGVRKYRVGSGYLFARPVPDEGRLLAAGLDGSLVALTAAVAPVQPLTLGSPGRPRDPMATAPPAPFRDAAGHWSAPALGIAGAMGLAEGYPDGTFRPDQPLSRAEMAALLARYLGIAPAGGGSAPSPAPFADVTGHWAQGAISALAARGLVGGVQGPDGRLRFEPDRPVRRGEAATLLSRIIGRQAPSPGFATRLQDLAGHWAAANVLALEEAGLVAGVPKGGSLVFEPDRSLSRAEALALLVRIALGGT